MIFQMFSFDPSQRVRFTVYRFEGAVGLFVGSNVGFEVGSVVGDVEGEEVGLLAQINELTS